MDYRKLGELLIGKQTEMECPQRKRWIVTDHKGRQFSEYGDTAEDARIAACTGHGLDYRKISVKAAR